MLEFGFPGKSRMMPGIIQAMGATAILLSVVVRAIRTGASWQAIDEGVATQDVLRDVTGILNPETLQDIFGPPRMEDGIFPVTRAEVLRQRTGIGYLLGDRWLDGASAAIAVLSLFPLWPLWGTRVWLDSLLMFAGLYQIAGWIAGIMQAGRR
jgi:hypothetical protein